MCFDHFQPESLRTPSPEPNNPSVPTGPSEESVPRVELEPPLPQPTESNELGRAQRRRVSSRRYQDYVASSSTAETCFLSSGNQNLPASTLPGAPDLVDNESLVNHAIVPPSQPVTSTTQRSDSPPTVISTSPNEFGLSKAYSGSQCLHTDPDSNLPLEALCDIKGVSIPDSEYADDSDTGEKPDNPSSDSDTDDPLGSRSARTLLQHFLHRNLNSLDGLDGLVNDFMENKIKVEKLKKVGGRRWRTKRVLKRVDNSARSQDSQLPDGWHEITLEIKLPLEGKRSRSEESAPTFRIKGVYCRKLVDAIKSMFQSAQFLKSHIIPHKRFFHRRHSPPSTQDASQKKNDTSESLLSDFQELGAERVYGELYESDLWIELQEKLNSLVDGDPEHVMDNVIAAIQVYSDATLVAAFGGKSAWPIYLQFGNHSKYKRAKPNLSTTLQIAFIPKLPDELQDFYREHYGKPASSHVLAHCKRELVHQLWAQLLDDEFVQAYHKGIVIRCYDGVERRIFPRFFTYAADYPEK